MVSMGHATDSFLQIDLFGCDEVYVLNQIWMTLSAEDISSSLLTHLM